MRYKLNGHKCFNAGLTLIRIHDRGGKNKEDDKRDDAEGDEHRGDKHAETQAKKDMRKRREKKKKKLCFLCAN